MISCLALTSRPKILRTVHECAHFYSALKFSHKEAIKRIGQHLKRTKDKGIFYEFDPTKGIEAHVDADFTRS